MAFSNTVNAVALKKSSTRKPTPPTTSRASSTAPTCWLRSSACAGSTSSRFSLRVAKEGLWVHDMGQRHQQERQERHHRQQRVIRHRPRQEHALVAAKAVEHIRKKRQDAA